MQPLLTIFAQKHTLLLNEIILIGGQPNAIVSHPADIRHNPVQTLSLRIASFTPLKAICLNVPADSLSESNWLIKSILLPTFSVIPTNFSVQLPAA